jgi:hypothetical protein
VGSFVQWQGTCGNVFRVGRERERSLHIKGAVACCLLPAVCCPQGLFAQSSAWEKGSLRGRERSHIEEKWRGGVFPKTQKKRCGWHIPFMQVWCPTSVKGVTWFVQRKQKTKRNRQKWPSLLLPLFFFLSSSISSFFSFITPMEKCGVDISWQRMQNM